MTVDEKLADLRARRKVAQGNLKALNEELQALKKEKWPTKCCRCWPSLVNEVGFCGCCDYDHVKGERLAFEDPSPDV